MNNFRYVLSTKILADNKRKIRFIYRENIENGDSGWRFFCGDEEQKYTDNIAIYHIKTIFDVNNNFKPYLNVLSGSSYERINKNDIFKLYTEFSFQQRMYRGGIK